MCIRDRVKGITPSQPAPVSTPAPAPAPAAAPAQSGGPGLLKRLFGWLTAVSYTHLDVYKRQSLGIALMESIQSDDPTAIIGLPLIALTTMLAGFGLDPLAAPGAPA